MEENYKGIKISVDETHNKFCVHLDKKYVSCYSGCALTEKLCMAKHLIDDYLNAIKQIGKTVIQINSGKIVTIDKITVYGTDVLYATKNNELIARTTNNHKVILENTKANLKLMKEYYKINEKIYKLNQTKAKIESKFDPILTVKIGDTWICRDGKKKYNLIQVGD